MNWKTIVYIILAVFLVFFIVVNLQNTSNISFIFFTIHDVPVFLTVFVSILLGSLLMLPLFIKNSKKRKNNSQISIDEEFDAKFLNETEKNVKAKRKKKKDKNTLPVESIEDLDIRK